MDSGNNYAIVETINKMNQPDVSAVPECWIHKGILYWPPGNKNVTLHVKKKTIPTVKWQQYPFKILKGNIGKLIRANYCYIFTLF